MFWHGGDGARAGESSGARRQPGPTIVGRDALRASVAFPPESFDHEGSEENHRRSGTGTGQGQAAARPYHEGTRRGKMAGKFSGFVSVAPLTISAFRRRAAGRALARTGIWAR